MILMNLEGWFWSIAVILENKTDHCEVNIVKHKNSIQMKRKFEYIIWHKETLYSYYFDTKEKQMMKEEFLID